MPRLWHDFGPLVGPGWAANALGGARILADWPWFDSDLAVADMATGLVRGVLAGGYRNRQTGEYAHNFKGNRDWLTPGSQAKIGLDALSMAGRAPDPERVELLDLAAAVLSWIDGCIDRGNLWLPRRVRPDGSPYLHAAEGGDEPLPYASAEALYIPWFRLEMALRGLCSSLERAASDIETWFATGRPSGSINHAVYDRDENVARALRSGCCCGPESSATDLSGRAWRSTMLWSVFSGFG